MAAFQCDLVIWYDPRTVCMRAEIALRAFDTVPGHGALKRLRRTLDAGPGMNDGGIAFEREALGCEVGSGDGCPYLRRQGDE